ncbi:MAG: hypothetical protein Q9203_007737, partial [Teloschistes exilis]
ENRTRLTVKFFRLQCTLLLLVWSAEVVVDLAAAGLRLRPAKGGSSKVQAEAWLAEEDFLALREAIAAYRAEQGRKKGKRKSICGGQRMSARRKMV